MPEELLRAAFEIARMGPTSANSQPMRILFVRSAEAKAKLEPALTEGNRAKTMAAPVYGNHRLRHRVLAGLSPHLHPRPHPDLRQQRRRVGNRPRFGNGTLGAAYFLVACRALGLDCGAMSGFDNAAVDEAFFAGTSTKSNFLCNLGWGKPESIMGPRLYRYEFEEVCRYDVSGARRGEKRPANAGRGRRTMNDTDTRTSTDTGTGTGTHPAAAPAPYRLVGSNGSPYSLKLRAILRYRPPAVRLELRTERNRAEFAGLRPPLIPILRYPEDGSFHVDTTPIAEDLERRHPGQRSILPDDPAHAFLCHLIEDLADEWLTKAMFHYRWAYDADIRYAGLWIADDFFPDRTGEAREAAARDFASRQIERMPLVGSTPRTPR